MQFGPTGEIYHKPTLLETARVFSEPPINVVEVTKHRDRFNISETVHWISGDKDRNLPDGRYTFAIRPHHVTPISPGKNAVEISGRVEVAELSGSESVIHFEAFGQSWVSQSHGVHPYASGETAQLFVDVSQAFYFDADGQLAGSEQKGK